MTRGGAGGVKVLHPRLAEEAAETRNRILPGFLHTWVLLESLSEACSDSALASHKNTFESSKEHCHLSFPPFLVFGLQRFLSWLLLVLFSTSKESNQTHVCAKTYLPLGLSRFKTTTDSVDEGYSLKKH